MDPFNSLDARLRTMDLQDPPKGAALDAFAKFTTNWYGNKNWYQPMAVYSILSRIQEGVHPNVFAIFGDKQHDFVCILIATSNIEADEELVLDEYPGFYLHQIAIENAIMNGCDGLRTKQCLQKTQIEQDVLSGRLFDVVRGNEPAPGWTGREFVERYSSEWTDYF